MSDSGRSVEWGLWSQFCQPILLQTKCTGFNNGIFLHVGKILFKLYENSDWKIWPLLLNQYLICLIKQNVNSVNLFCYK